MNTKYAALALAALVFLPACPKDEAPVSTAEAKEALTEASASSQASDLTATTVELSTNFTLGGAAQAAAAELRTFIGTQLPCADITLADSTLTVTYGAKPGNCTYRGHTFSGRHAVTVTRADGEVKVDHTWTDLSNGIIKVSGTANVTWSAASASRHVVHRLTWTRLADGVSGTGTGDRTQTALAGGVAEGIRVDGTRSWEGPKGRWDLAITGVEMRWGDPVPQAGSYSLGLPSGKTVSMAFARADADRIKVTITAGTRTFSFVVRRAGQVDGA